MHNTPAETSLIGVDVTFPERARWRLISRRRLPLSLWFLLALAAGVVISLATPARQATTGEPSSSRSVNTSGMCTSQHEPVKRALSSTCPRARADIRAEMTSDALLPPPTDPQAILTQMTTNGIQGLIDFVKGQFLDWASSFGFMYITPASLTYKLLTVRNAGNWAVGVLDGVTALLLSSVATTSCWPTTWDFQPAGCWKCCHAWRWPCSLPIWASFMCCLSSLN